MVDDFGGTRSDPGMLGAGIYFASSARCVYVPVYVYVYIHVPVGVCMCVACPCTCVYMYGIVRARVCVSFTCLYVCV